MIFRIHSNGPIDIKAWGSRGNILKDDAIKDINDDLIQGNSAKVATSIPNPFARMYLFETAFQMIKDSQHVGNNLYHQLVSDCLDVFQLLFMMGSNNKNIRFKKWNCQNRIDSLKSLGDISVSGKLQPHGHKLLGLSLELFTNSKRFNDFNDLYLIYYKDILLGGTSPITIFFTSPNFQREMEENGIAFPPSHSTDILFDRIPAALHERDIDFQLYMHKLRAAFKIELGNACPELNQYLIKSAANFNHGILNDIDDDYEASDLISEYEKINVDPVTTESLNSGIFPVLKYPEKRITDFIATNSGFVIQNTVDYFKNYLAEDGTKVNLPIPLALISNCNASITYINQTWEPNTIVEYRADKELHKRVLPKSENTEYPFITTEDFLEDKLIEMPYSINNEFFFSGFSGKFEYLLPIKKEYFNFFKLEDLNKNLSINNDPEKVTIVLRIPVRDGNEIEFMKIYNKKTDVYKLSLPIFGFGIGIFPFYQVIDNANLHLNDYSILLIDNTEKDIDLNFYQLSGIINNETLNYKKKIRQPKTNESPGSIYYKIENNTNNAFDIIEIINGEYQGLIIPKFKKVNIQTHTQKFNFAIDFGTSNTHIAYNTASEPEIKPFDINLKDIQMVMLNSRGKDTGASNIGDTFNYGVGSFYEMIAIKNREFVPSIIGDNSNIKYPVRTSTCESKSFIAETPEIFGNINIGYNLDAEAVNLDHTRYMTNIKWGMENNPGGIPEQNRVSVFFEQIMWMIKNKILLNNGTLDPNISWFVPMSMKMPIRNIFGKKWNEAKNKIFGNDSVITLTQESESTVPYFYLKNKHGFYGANDALNIDIGGGTIDIIFLSNSTNKSYSTSSKFGANNIWGDGITHLSGTASQKDNGFFLMMKEKIESNELKLDGKIRNYYQTFYKNTIFNSADMISFLFKYDDSFNFSNSIQAHPYLQTLLFLHFSSVIFHISQIIKEKNIKIPMYLTFTGKGSEYIKIIFPDAQIIDDTRQSEIDKFTSLLLKKFTGKEIDDIFKVYLEKNPKEVTANGGISMVTAENIDINPEEVIQKGFSTNHTPENYDTNSKKLKNKDLDNIEIAVLNSINEFIEILITDEELNEFFNRYNISFQFGDENLLQKVQRYAPHSFNQIKTDLKKHGMPDDIVEESPFFWGLKDVFYRLSKELYRMS